MQGQGKARQGREGHDRAGHGRIWHDRTGQGKAGQGREGHGMAGRGRTGHRRVERIGHSVIFTLVEVMMVPVESVSWLIAGRHILDDRWIFLNHIW